MLLAFILPAMFPAFSQKRLAVYCDGKIEEHHLLSKIDSIRFVSSPQAGFWIHKTDSLIFYADRRVDSLVFLNGLPPSVSDDLKFPPSIFRWRVTLLFYPRIKPIT